jgi:Na+/H+ antiporter
VTKARRAGKLAGDGRGVHHGTEFWIVLVAMVALAVGAATRGLARRLGVPYTIALLLAGLLGGFGLDASGTGATDGVTHRLLSLAASITPDLIIFVFLPALVFESAFSLDAYGFRKNLGGILTLAVPSMIASTVLVAAAVVLLTRNTWQLSLSTALVFGALISATDPVAVVAILRELGAPKRLGLLIEGESLLNDGTAIVLFNVLLAALVAGSGQVQVGAAAVEFLRVTFGGVAVGAALGAGGAFSLSRTFNDPLVEITLTLVMAYAAMVLAEGFLHVSGVMAIVTAGLWMSGPGRPSISPEVQHFLHQFWQMLAYVANTLIFVLVGVLVASQLEHASWSDILLIVAIYLAVMLVRFGVTFASMPLINRVIDPISVPQATVMGWSGLRGAVSLALALVLAQHPGLPSELRGRLLLLTAGVAFLTIVVNGSTMGALLRRFGFDRPHLGEQLAQAVTRAHVLQHVAERTHALARELKSVDWSEVQRSLDAKRREADTSVARARAQLQQADEAGRKAGYVQQTLNVERQEYWRLYGQGTIGARALRVLLRELDVQSERLGRGEVRPPDSRLAIAGDWTARLSRWLRELGVSAGGIQFEHLALVYAVARASSTAAARVLHFIDALQEADPAVTASLRETYRRYRREGLERLEDIRTHLPEMSRAIETRLAQRIELNVQREDYERLAHEGAMDEQAAAAQLDAVQEQMKRLQLSPTRLQLPETAELCRRAPLFAELDEEELAELAELTVERVFNAGDVIFRQGDRGESMFIIARGAVHVVREQDGEEEVVDVLGGGDILGEMALLTGEPRNATIHAATTVTVGEIRREDFERLMRTQPRLKDGVWRAFLGRDLANHMRGRPDCPQLTNAQRHRWVQGARIERLDGGESLQSEGARYVFVLGGRVHVGGREEAAPQLLSIDGAVTITAISDAAVALLGALPEEAGEGLELSRMSLWSTPPVR